MRSFVPANYPTNTPVFLPQNVSYPMTTQHFPIQNYQNPNDNEKMLEDMKNFYHKEFEKNRTYILDECQNVIVRAHLIFNR